MTGTGKFLRFLGRICIDQERYSVMSNTYEATCLICGHWQAAGKFGDYQCSSCGQKYTYGEGHMIELTAEQREALSKL